ncbi:hypothetical protein [Lacisediminihabitans sp.]|jgi:hypothetical protein
MIEQRDVWSCPQIIDVFASREGELLSQPSDQAARLVQPLFWRE